MQPSGMQANGALLALDLFGVGLGEELPAGGDSDFLTALGDQIKARLLDAGESRDALDGVDGQALALQLLALMQGQIAQADAASSRLGLSLSATPGAADGAGQTLSLSEALGTPGVAGEADPAGWGKGSSAPAPGSRPHQDLNGSRGALAPGALLQLLQESSTQGQRMESPLAATRAVAAADEYNRLIGSLAAEALRVLPGAAGEEMLDYDLARLLGADGAAQGAGLVRAQGAESSAPCARDPVAWEGLLPSDADAASGEVDGQVLATGSSGPGGALGLSGAQRPQVLDLYRLLQGGGERILADQVKWVVQQDLEMAEIRLHPPSLGALDVRVTMEGDLAHVQFVSPHPIAREVIEASLSRLRDALAEQGLTPGQITVSDQPAGDRGGAERDRSEWSGERRESDAEGAELPADPTLADSTLSALSRRLDYFV